MTSTPKSDNLRYHRHLSAVGVADVDYVLKKDKDYDASWKRRGGRGAWFTMVRPWDRLESMLRRKFTDDIFIAINEEGLEGPDGSVIACVRDLRRYLLLLECEMMEQAAQRDPEDAIRYGLDRAAPGGDKTMLTLKSGDEMQHADVTGMNFSEIEKRMALWIKDNHDSAKAENEDIYDRLAQEFGIPRHRVKARMFQIIYGGNPPYESVEETGRRVFSAALDDRVKPDHDGSQHASLHPYVATWGAINSARPEAREAWKKVGPGMFVIEHRITPEVWAALPLATQGVFIPVYRANLSPTIGFKDNDYSYCADETYFAKEQTPLAYWLDVAHVPPNERVRWPSHQEEQNATEWKGLMEFQELYEWWPDPQKFILRNKHKAWKD